MSEALESNSGIRPRLLDGFLTDRQLEAEPDGASERAYVARLKGCR